MFILTYDVIFGYVSHLFVEFFFFNKLGGFVSFIQRDYAFRRLMRFRHLPYWHPS